MNKAYCIKDLIILDKKIYTKGDIYDYEKQYNMVTNRLFFILYSNDELYTHISFYNEKDEFTLHFGDYFIDLTEYREGKLSKILDI